ncbi:hypothetical protein IF655_10615 [Streptomyces sp. DSM 110735]|uniref:hypothetical protein n=1 Tax=Streptomyces sp. DSM 110735 TaxID=2775031 RepID=UPI0018F6360D|nr:hypothetical protein [Streptomyces sp. DSM 110735]MBJ7903751.1 hypothetical protein [Streptomyces sp. DSM 110735]
MVPAPAWTLLPDLAERLRAAITALPEAAISELPGAAGELDRFVARPESPR